MRLPLYTLLRQKKISELLEKGVFQIVTAKNVPFRIGVFNSQFIDETKNSGTNQAFKKSCLVVEVYNNFNKNFVLTQSPTIHQVSQRLIVCLATIPQNNMIKLQLCKSFKLTFNQVWILIKIFLFAFLQSLLL